MLVLRRVSLLVHKECLTPADLELHFGSLLVFKNWLFKTSTEKTQRTPLHETNMAPAKKTYYSSIQGNVVPFLDAIFSRIQCLLVPMIYLPLTSSITYSPILNRSKFSHGNQQKRGNQKNVPINQNPWPIHGLPPSILTPKPNLTQNPKLINHPNPSQLNHPNHPNPSQPIPTQCNSTHLQGFLSCLISLASELRNLLNVRPVSTGKPYAGWMVNFCWPKHILGDFLVNFSMVDFVGPKKSKQILAYILFIKNTHKLKMTAMSFTWMMELNI